ncbi:MAG: NUDIX hydrolase [Candidatus Omnitrophica bacterium]|nr:NUDIX hydrolase [Candidatus Omnitrophota bacterium]
MAYSRKSVFQGRLLKVYKSIKKLPNGICAYFEEIEHPGAVIVIPFLKDRIVFINQYRAVIGKYLLELPAGKLDPGESLVSCANREVAEETGYRLKNLKKLGFIYTTPGFTDEKIYIFKAECSGRVEAEKDRDELITVKYLSVKEVRKLFRSGKLSDSKTISTLCFAGIL